MSRWPLAVLLDLANREQAAARNALSLALDLQARQRNELDASARALQAHRSAEINVGDRAPPRGPSAAVLRDAALHRARLRAEGVHLAEDLRARAAALALAEREVEELRDALAAARAAAAALERHRGDWRALQARARARAEDRRADDLVSARRRAAR